MPVQSLRILYAYRRQTKILPPPATFSGNEI
jgi:hypothetical protein